MSLELLQFSPAEQARDKVITMVWDLVSLSTIKTMTMGRGGGMQAAHLQHLLVHAARA